MKQLTQQHMLAKAILIASEGHLEVMDKGGKAYILHPIQVMYNLNTEDPELKQIAILHDVIEDCIKFLMIKKFCENMSLEEASEKANNLLSNLSQEEKVGFALEILTSWGFSKRVTSALKLMTKLSTDKGEEGYFNYINRMFDNIDAIRVKLADIRHNTDILRMKGLTDKDFARNRKYCIAFNMLTKRLAELCVPSCIGVQ